MEAVITRYISDIITSPRGSRPGHMGWLLVRKPDLAGPQRRRSLDRPFIPSWDHIWITLGGETTPCHFTLVADLAVIHPTSAFTRTVPQTEVFAGRLMASIRGLVRGQRAVSKRGWPASEESHSLNSEPPSGECASIHVSWPRK